MASPIEILEKYWSHKSFKPLQEEIINSALEKRDTLALLPTGGGKSICFQIPAILNEGITIVVSPLIALMKDQVENLKSKGIRALAVHSGMTGTEVDATLDNAIYGSYKFLYLSPERLRTDIFMERVKKMNVAYLVVDEAHCISQWGYDFRPDYLKIKDIKELCGNPPTLALTATATPSVADDIMEKLGFASSNLIRGSFFRANLSYVVRFSEDKYGELLRVCRSVNGSGIVYVRERKRAEEVSVFLNSQGVNADSYHAGYSSGNRTSKQDDWMLGSTRVIVSTNAFGMGIDKGDVRFVIHFDLPESVEAYYQEAGRAGRDGLRSYAVMLWNSSDVKRLRQIVNLTFPKPDFIKEIYQKLYRFYNLAYGSGKGDIFRFNLQEFSQKNKINASSAYYAIKYLEGEGLLKLTEELDNPSRITFIVNRDELYMVQLKSDSMDAFIKTILRIYPGLFSGYVSIDEEYIARLSRNSKAAVVSMLVKLSGMGIVSYIPGARSPLLMFNEDREEERGFYLSSKNYESRRAGFETRVESVIGYAGESTICRSQYLSRYFGEESSALCGICDVCISARKSRDEKGYEQTIERRIIEILMDGPKRLDEISALVNDETRCYLDILRSMVDRGGVRLENETLYLNSR